MIESLSLKPDGHEQTMRLGDIRWQHRTNSVRLFHEALNTPSVHAIETDFAVKPDGKPVGYHPPSSSPYVVDGDLSLKTALSLLVAYNRTHPDLRKIFKIDAKALGVIAYLNQLRELAGQLADQPLIVNYDIFQGVSVHESDIDGFIALCHSSPFDVIISPGFETNANPDGVYTEEDIDTFLHLFGGQKNVTLPVRIDWVANKPRSWGEVLRVLEHGFPLTFWNGDNCEPWMIDWVKAHTDPTRCMYDFFDLQTVDRQPLRLEW